MRSFTQREPRNTRAGVLPNAPAERVVVTRRGQPVAQFAPVAPETPPARGARRAPLFDASALVTVGVPSRDLLEEVRRER